MIFDTSLYGKLALHTESNDFDSIRKRITLNCGTLFSDLARFQEISEALDKHKKQIFYGKDFVVPNNPIIFQGDLDDGTIRAAHAILGIATEAGELVENLLAYINGDKEDKDFLINCFEENGDLDWYMNILRDLNGRTLNMELDANLNKLLVKRYGLNFDANKAVNRDLTAELSVLANPNIPAEDQFIELQVNDLLLDLYTDEQFLVVFKNEFYALLSSDTIQNPVILKSADTYVDGAKGYINPKIVIVTGSDDNGKPKKELATRFCFIKSTML